MMAKVGLKQQNRFGLGGSFLVSIESTSKSDAGVCVPGNTFKCSGCDGG